MPSLYSTYVYKQYIACSRQAFTWNSWFERKLLSYCGGVRTWVRLCGAWGSNLGSTPPRSSHPPCGAFSSNVSSSQVNKVITLCKASGHYTCLKCLYNTLVDQWSRNWRSVWIIKVLYWLHSIECRGPSPGQWLVSGVFSPISGICFSPDISFFF